MPGVQSLAARTRLATQMKMTIAQAFVLGIGLHIAQVIATFGLVSLSCSGAVAHITVWL